MTGAVSAGSKPAAQWIAAGPNTWRIGEWTVYRSLLPQPVFWVSSGSGRPKRVGSRDKVMEVIAGEGGDD